MSSSERKRAQDADPDTERTVKKRKAPSKAKGKGKVKQTAPEWPEYFNNVRSRRFLGNLTDGALPAAF